MSLPFDAHPRLQCKFYELKVSFVHTCGSRTKEMLSKYLSEWMNEWWLNWAGEILLKDVRIKHDHCNKIGKQQQQQQTPHCIYGRET